LQILRDSVLPLKIAALDIEVADKLISIPREIVPDMPDRIIAATALKLNLPLVTKDEDVRKLTNVVTIW
jgi:predicted nucleic acid-binding protein